MKNIDIIGACSDLGVHVDGARLGPEKLEGNINTSNIHKIKNIQSNNIKKELEKNNKKKNLTEINKFNINLYHTVLNSINNHYFPITLGGDHSIAVASALASIKKYEKLGIIWFDAHGDYHTFKTTTSGNVHGLPFAGITGYERQDLSDFHDGNYYPYQNAVLLGASDVDKPEELQNLKDAGVTIFTAEDIRNKGTKEIYQKAFEIASKGTNGIHISYDIDVIDPKIAPGVSIPTYNGINLEEAYAFVDYMIKNKEKLKSIDLVEFNPTRDIEQKTEKIATHILNKLIENI